MTYKFIAQSITDPNGNKGALGFNTREEAEKHCAHMNSVRLTYPDGWNTDHWKALPGEWVIKELTP